MGYNTGEGTYGKGPEGCADWAEITRAKPRGQGTQTEGGSATLASDPDRVSNNYQDIPFDGPGKSQPRQVHPGFPDLFTP